MGQTLIKNYTTDLIKSYFINFNYKYNLLSHSLKNQLYLKYIDTDNYTENQVNKSIDNIYYGKFQMEYSACMHLIKIYISYYNKINRLYLEFINNVSKINFKQYYESDNVSFIQLYNSMLHIFLRNYNIFELSFNWFKSSLSLKRNNNEDINIIYDCTITNLFNLYINYQQNLILFYNEFYEATINFINDETNVEYQLTLDSIKSLSSLFILFNYDIIALQEKFNLHSKVIKHCKNERLINYIILNKDNFIDDSVPDMINLIENSNVDEAFVLL
jgi:hypothetical protein